MAWHTRVLFGIGARKADGTNGFVTLSRERQTLGQDMDGVPRRTPILSTGFNTKLLPK
jgi:hypothetical protein